MANVGYTGGEEGGSVWPSNARQSGRVSGTSGADGFTRGSQLAHNGMVDNDPLDTRGDVFDTPGAGVVCTD